MPSRLECVKSEGVYEGECMAGFDGCEHTHAIYVMQYMDIFKSIHSLEKAIFIKFKNWMDSNLVQAHRNAFKKTFWSMSERN